jgi:hypothetical protein
VFNYKSEPGRFLNEWGQPVTEQLARSAGFDVDAHRRQRMKREKLDEAAAIIEAELATPAAETHEIISEVGGFALVDLGLNRYAIEFGGERVTPRAVTLATAQALLKKLAPQPGAGEAVRSSANA